MFKWIKSLIKPDVVVIPAPPLPDIPTELLPKLHERKIHLGIIVGHDKKDQGATMLDGTTEYQYGKKVLESCMKQMEKFPGLVVSGIFRDGQGIRGAYNESAAKKCDAVVELHFNASNGGATGSLTLCTPDVNDVEFAHEIHNNICRAFDRKGQSRGVMVIGKTTRGSACVYAFPDGVNCLVEPFFGDNKSDAELGQKKLEAYALSILQGAFNWGVKSDLISARQIQG